MRLSELLTDTGAKPRHGDLEREISAVAITAAEVEPGAMFVAAPDAHDGGDSDIITALRRGAAAVIAEPRQLIGIDPGAAALIEVAEARRALGYVLANACDRPGDKLRVLAVTGTNGKTTTTWLLHQLLTATGHRPGLIGTIELRYGDVVRPARFTTPPATVLQPTLAEMRAAGCTHVALEATSHALALHRLAGVPVQVAGFTNLTRDHLDFHGTPAAYAAAKARLFSEHAVRACLAVDDEVGREFAAHFLGDKLTVSTRGEPADLQVVRVDSDWHGTRADLQTPWGPRTLKLQLLGHHNVQNALVALGMAILEGLPLEGVLMALANATPAAGRSELIRGERRVIVDYAHTPDALDRLLTTLRPLTSGRLICVFGAGGDRDRGKRPLMGAAVAAHADLAVVTSDNPRSEDPAAIIADIVEGLHDVARIIEPDRHAAIRRALAAATRDDVVVVAGKGHEITQTIGRKAHVFDDRAVVRELLTELTME